MVVNREEDLVSTKDGTKRGKKGGKEKVERVQGFNGMVNEGSKRQWVLSVRITNTKR